ncbi:MAG TPA: UvrD-helicase domain-containing protein [Bacillus sp. (in: firmicutes)]|uniref:UvrD-helicase domain-containing protein n=1 Tax=Paenibacillus ehimensis TaxID=79264 RepID=UPI002B8B5138|nr:UvrD-helicase domain-containing protein [Paenibacillus ehimensis]MEC0209785.1 AAA family ATPase [Paenibacillus ehimensis]HWO78442.1 UvrD-helicase domain-containing protein [Bacillus sp. (in: firmicutes)]
MVSEIEELVYSCIDNGESFIIEAGAGSGKTWTLVQSLKYVISRNESFYRKKHKKLACITYTNVAKEEIISRINGNEIVEVKTIHDFLWRIIEPFQSELKNELLIHLKAKLEKDRDIVRTSKVTTQKYKDAEAAIVKNSERIEALENLKSRIQYNENANYKKGIISHDVMLEISRQIIKRNKVIKKIIQDTYPIIFIDEYQDTKDVVANVLLEDIKSNTKIIFGLFGDYHQQIYGGSIGKIDPIKYGLKSIQKTENYRCSTEVIYLLNKLRDDQLEQKPAGEIKSGKCLFYYINDEELETEHFINEHLLPKFSVSSSDKVKKLYLVTKAIAKKNNYLELHELYDEKESPTFRVGQIKQSFVDMLLPGNRKQNKLINIIYGLLSSEMQDCIDKGMLVNNDEKFIEEINKKVVKYKDFNKLDIFNNDVQQFEGENLKYDVLNRRLLELYFPNSLSKYGRAEERREKKKDMILKNSNNRDCPFANFLFDIEELIELYQQNKVQALLYKTCFKILNVQDKIKLNKLMKELIEKSSKDKVFEMFEFVLENHLLECPKKLEIYLQTDAMKDSFFYDLMDLEYAQFQRLYYTIKETSPFSTNHGTKGAEFDHVVCFINDRDWDHYNLDGYLSESDKDQNQKYDRTKNLFYVVCSRAKFNLAIVVLSELSEKSILKAKTLFGEESFIQYNALPDQMQLV